MAADADSLGSSRGPPHCNFDDLLGLEGAFHQEGLNDGRARGAAMGGREGASVGVTYGHKIGVELGFYAGCCEAWMALAAKHNPAEGKSEASSVFNQRTCKSLHRLKRQLATFVCAPGEDDLVERLAAIRSKVRLIATRLKTPLAMRTVHPPGRAADDTIGEQREVIEHSEGTVVLEDDAKPAGSVPYGEGRTTTVELDEWLVDRAVSIAAKQPRGFSF